MHTSLSDRLRACLKNPRAHLVLFLWILVGAVSLLDAQAPPPAPAPTPPKNYISNGGFEKVITFQNLYDGVDARGDVRVQRGESSVFLEGGNPETIPFACSPNFVDVNGDGLPDLVVASPDGHLYWYPNIGKKGGPGFDHAQLVQTFVGSRAFVFAIGTAMGNGSFGWQHGW